MRIVFDAYELILGQGKSIGIYNYAKYLFKALIEIIDDTTEIYIICNATNISDFTCNHKAIKNIVIQDFIPGKFSRLIWFYGRAALTVKKLEADIYFSPKGFLPKGIRLVSPKTKTVVVIHDLIPLWYKEHYPSYFGRLEELFINHAIVTSAKFADRVIAISKATADEIALRCKRITGVSVVHNGIAFTKPGPRPYAKPYIFAMASQLPHKNADGILAAYRSYCHYVNSPLPLFICGISGLDEERVIFVKDLDNATLHAYYAHADVFVFLSLVEGFGFPPVEALSHGTPVICSDIPSLREIAKELATYVPPEQANTVGKKIAELLSQDISIDKKNARINILNKYTWNSCAIGILKAITN